MPSKEIVVTQSLISTYSKCSQQGYLKYFANAEYFKNLKDHSSLDPKNFDGNGLNKKSAFHTPLYAGSLMDMAIELWKDSIVDMDLNLDKILMLNENTYLAFTQKAVNAITKRFIKEDTEYDKEELSFTIKQAVFALPYVFRGLAEYYERANVVKTITKIPFRIKLDNGFMLSGEIDELLMTSDNRIIVNDYKLLKSVPDPEMMRDDFQGKTYVTALHLYEKWEDFALDKFLGKRSIKEFTITEFTKFVVKKPQIKMKKTENLVQYRARYIESLSNNISVHSAIFPMSKVSSCLGEIDSFCRNHKYKSLSKTRYKPVCNFCDFREMCVDMDNVDIVRNLYATNFSEKSTRNRELMPMKKMENLEEFFLFWVKVPERFENRLHFLMNVSRNTKLAISEEIRQNYRKIYQEFVDRFKSEPTQITNLPAMRLLSGGTAEVIEAPLQTMMTMIQSLHNAYKREIDNEKGSFPEGTTSIIEIKHEDDAVFNAPKQVTETTMDQLTAEITSSVQEASDAKVSDEDKSRILSQLEKLPVNIRPTKGFRRTQKMKAEFDMWTPIAKNIGITLSTFLEMKASGIEKGLIDEEGQAINQSKGTETNNTKEQSGNTVVDEGIRKDIHVNPNVVDNSNDSIGKPEIKEDDGFGDW